MVVVVVVLDYLILLLLGYLLHVQALELFRK